MKESKKYLWYAPEKYNTFTRRSELDLILDFCFGASRSTATLGFVCRHSVSAFAHFPTNRNLVAAIPLVHRFCPRKDRFKIWRPGVFKHTCKNGCGHATESGSVMIAWHAESEKLEIA